MNSVGAPALTLTPASATAHGRIAVRLTQMHPDGASTRITWGLLNPTHRALQTDPAPLVPGQRGT